ncbi:class I SAM-dependent methyltransferase [Algoriphagus hitonicola]|uniref:Methyltransferase domain-containing protein n=1 Tax=Algoriphagus hitonicola TaxID=435880 RepID=A0A1I2TSX3_9BACT|nr:class I SAM-dependent methyltransferase [Algoriphagus hitonicola]SFG65461.1 Methyltransferase domain-containing protein [Algoriphagus hitonicola]
MTHLQKSALFLSLGLILFWPAISQAQKSDAPYTFETPSRDGTGKFYLGREISQIMGFQGMKWLERSSREREEGVSKAISNLPISEESVVADIGAGSGYYTFRIAPLVPEGKVLAVEIQDEAIRFLENKSQELGFDQVEAVKGNSYSPNLPENAVDVAIMVDVYHELAYPAEMLQALRSSLKTNGKLILIEYRGEDPSIPIKPLHKMTQAQAEKELNENGFRLVENGDFLPIQHYLIFEKLD